MFHIFVISALINCNQFSELEYRLKNNTYLTKIQKEEIQLELLKVSSNCTSILQK